jgi:hypothetical protein
VHWDLIFKFAPAHAELFFDGEKVFSGGKWLKKFTFLN